MMDHRLEVLPRLILVGKRMTMSFSDNRTAELWKDFRLYTKAIYHALGGKLYSVEDYKVADYFTRFDPARPFEKWAAVRCSHDHDLPEGLEALVIPKGLYIVFNYRGKGDEAAPTYRYILEDWLPGSGYTLDNRPHFAVMDAQYKNEDPASEETLWFPVRKI